MSEINKRTMVGNHMYRPDFRQYDRDNPYNDKLGVFDSFVMRDEAAETHAGKWHEVFQNNSPLEVEIGSGYGDFMMEYCQAHPEISFVGMDHRFKRSFNVAKKLDKIEHKNFRYLRGKGERLEFIFAESEVSALHYYFPDPWPKTRHHKKRLFQRPFLDASHKVLKPNGLLYVKTDHDGYFEWMLREIQQEKRFEVLLLSKDLRREHPQHFLSQFSTKFEKIFLSQGTLIKAMVLRNIK